MFLSRLFSSRQPAISANEQAQIERAITLAEAMTSGEIKVIIESQHIRSSVSDRALALFQKYRLFETELRNGVLVYVALRKKSFYILADEGIYTRLGKEYWEQLSHQAVTRIQSEQSWVVGICHAIDFLGTSLKEAYPIAQNDKNELNNRIEFL